MAEEKIILMKFLMHMGILDMFKFLVLFPSFTFTFEGKKLLNNYETMARPHDHNDIVINTIMHVTAHITPSHITCQKWHKLYVIMPKIRKCL